MTFAVRKKLGDVLTFQRGHDITKKEQTPGPFPVISSGGASSTHTNFRYHGPGVVIGRKGSLGGVYFSEGPYWPHDTTLWVRDFKGNDPRYLYYLLKTLQLERLDVGASNPTLNRNHLHLLDVGILPAQLQRPVADRLSAFDALVENNRRQIEILAEIARLLYREWFVHLRFPGHEGLQLVDSELGPIPEGWTATRLGEVAAEMTDGDWIETKDQGGSAYRLLQVSNIGVGSFRETGKFRYVTAETFERLRCTEIQLGDVLISRMPDPVGRAWLVDRLATPAITAVDVAILRPAGRHDGVWIEQFMNRASTLAHAEQVATGTTRKRVSRSVLAEFPVVWPPADMRAKFAASIGPALELRTNLIQQSEVLLSARDLLLPRLVSGELDVSVLDLEGVVS